MSNPNTLLPHEVIASDEYWSDPQPGLSRGEVFQQTVEIWKGIRHHELGRTIGRYVFDMTAGFEQEQVPEGQDLPVPDENSRQVLKVVQDARAVIAHPISRGPVKSTPEAIANFDALATQMTDEILYQGPSISLKLPSHFKGFDINIRRTTMYVRATRDERFLAGVTSGMFDENGELILPLTCPIPKGKVGQGYKDAVFPVTRRIISANVLEPTGIAWHKHKGDNHKKKEPKRAERRSWFPSPLPAPGY